MGSRTPTVARCGLTRNRSASIRFTSRDVAVEQGVKDAVLHEHEDDGGPTPRVYPRLTGWNVRLCQATGTERNHHMFRTGPRGRPHGEDREQSGQEAHGPSLPGTIGARSPSIAIGMRAASLTPGTPPTPPPARA
jgi:hypothetical protein